MRWLLFVTIVFASCADREGTALRVVLPIQLPALCENVQNLSSMTAVLFIEDHDPCALAIDDAGLVTGSCEEIALDRNLALAIVYSLPGTPEVALAYHFSSANSPAKASDVTVVFPAETLVIDQDVLDAVDGVTPAPDENTRVMQWAITTIIQPQGLNLDTDGDGDANLTELCEGD